MATGEEPRAPETLDEELLEAEVAEVLSTLDDQTRVQRIREEIEYGFEALAHVGAGVSVFGSARHSLNALRPAAERRYTRRRRPLSSLRSSSRPASARRAHSVYSCVCGIDQKWKMLTCAICFS